MFAQWWAKIEKGIFPVFEFPQNLNNASKTCINNLRLVKKKFMTFDHSIEKKLILKDCLFAF